MKFKIGDKVKYLDEIGEGIVKNLWRFSNRRG